MARWRAVAIESLPELRNEITSADGVMAAWIEIHMAFDDAYREPRNDGLIERIYGFAEWCMRAPRNDNASHDPPTAAMIGFFESIAKFKPSRDDMPRWFEVEEIQANRPLYGYYLSDDDFAALLMHVRKNEKAYRGRPNGDRKPG